MPNHTSTILTIRGKDTEISKFIKDVSSDESNLTFNKIHPLPKNETDNWYDWHVKNWGTKWDAYHVGNWDLSNHLASIYYETAWSPATQFYLHVSNNYNLKFKHEFADEGGSFLGYQNIENGIIIDEVYMNWNSHDGIALRQKLGCYYEDDDEDEDEDEN